jgi:hypothetical protein
MAPPVSCRRVKQQRCGKRQKGRAFDHPPAAEQDLKFALMTGELVRLLDSLEEDWRHGVFPGQEAGSSSRQA